MVLMAGVAFAGELTGKYSGTFDPGPAYMDLKVAGQAVTGTVGPSETEQLAISNGKLDGEKLTFELSRPGGAVVKFDLTFDGESIKGTVTAVKEGQQMNAKVEVKRKG